MIRTQEITVAGLIVGDTIIEGKAGIVIKEITDCPQTVLRGVPKIHVNGTMCYNTICPVTIKERSQSDD